MLFPYSDPAKPVSEPPGDFSNNYKYLKRLVNRALKEGTPIEDLHLIDKHSASRKPKPLSREDLIKLLHTLRRIRTRYQRLLEPPVPRELERDILAKAPEERLPWEEEALGKIEQWRRDVRAVRNQVRRELNEHLKKRLFKGI
ncbi:MAG: hypothetical protein FJ118_06080 [Deltaproteobacteria bacterium]|nr:hypothetical protein [Deltaproteobacteria bacterium]